MVNIEVLFLKHPKIIIELFFYNTGDINYEDNVPSVSKNSIKIKAIELPTQVSKSWVRRVSDTKYEKGFLFKYPGLTPNFYIVYLNQRYNCKDVQDVTKDYFIAYAAAMPNEKHT